MAKTCPECGEPIRGLPFRRIIGLWLRVKLEGLAVWVDRKTAEPYDPVKHRSHLHLTDEEWAAVLSARK